MKITIESTEMLTSVNGLRCRVWRGVTEEGIACDLAIALIRVRTYVDRKPFDRALRSLAPPAPLPPWDGQAHFECPDCKAVSFNPNDIQHGYCGACHTVTRRAERVDMREIW